MSIGERTEKIAILDCGGQYTKVIDRKVRELGVNTDIRKITDSAAELNDYDAFILSGGANMPDFTPEIFNLGKPMLGICAVFQSINEYFGGKSIPKSNECGQAEININQECELFAGFDKKELVFMNCSDEVEKIADGFECVAKTGDDVAAIYNKNKKIVAVRFHPEVELTINGTKIFENFLRKICGLKEVYALEDRIETSVKMIKEKVGDNNVIVLVSGGVDSMVTAALLLKALPSENVYAIHVDHGFMRKNENKLVSEILNKVGFKNLEIIDAREEFLNERVEIDGELAPPLCEVSDPELKRQIIGSIFIEIVKKAADTFKLDYDKTFIAQGTLRPDLIESGNPDVSTLAKKIKTHHNDVDIVRRARERGMIVETNWDWHKDEVRQVARILGIDEEIASRQPFPGPGLAVRLICYPQKNNTNNIDNLGNIDNLFEKINSNTDIKGTVAPILSVGVQGDERSYKQLCVLYGKGIDCDFEELAQTVINITNQSKTINRCVYVLNNEDMPNDFDNKFKCTDLSMARENIELLREIDYIVTSNFAKEKNKISQCLGVLVPISTTENKYSAVIRAVVTTDFMTARAAVIGKDISIETIKNITNEIKSRLSEIDLVLYDVTNKPPSTVEWE